MELENYTRDGGAIEYSKAANPLANGTTPPMPIFEFPPDNYEGRPTGITPLDLSELLKCDSPASSPGLLASFIHVTAGDTLTVRVNATSQLIFTRCGTGIITISESDASIPYQLGDLVTIPATADVTISATSDTILYWVHDEPLLRYLGVTATEPKFRPTLYPWDVTLAAVHDALITPAVFIHAAVPALLKASQICAVVQRIGSVVRIHPRGLAYRKGRGGCE